MSVQRRTGTVGGPLKDGLVILGLTKMVVAEPHLSVSLCKRETVGIVHEQKTVVENAKKGLCPMEHVANPSRSVSQSAVFESNAALLRFGPLPSCLVHY